MRALSGVQVRYETLSTGVDYVTGKLWLYATLPGCPWHPEGGCGFCLHGTYPRVKPRGALIRRWYCPLAQRTVSALPDALAAHFSGTLADCEACVVAVEQAESLLAAAASVRTDIELPGALRYLSRLCKAIQSVLKIARGLLPEHYACCAPTIAAFSDVIASSGVLHTLRHQLAFWLPMLPAPLGFNRSPNSAPIAFELFQHTTGRDPPMAQRHPACEPIADRYLQENIV